MIKLICDKIPRILKSKKILEKELKIKIENRGKEIYLSGKPENEYSAEKVIEALNFGFPLLKALDIAKEDLMFEIINIKECTNAKNLGRVRGRIIGKKGSTLKTISELTNCNLEIQDNKIGIIGYPEEIKNAVEACKSLSKGTKQANVYAYLEKHHPKPVIDLGLREKK